MKNKINSENVNWYLQGLLANGRKWVIPINKFPFIIGRSPTCDLNIASKEISRNHAEVNTFGNSIVLIDMNSTNGTFVNNKKITSRITLISGDVIHFGDVEFKILNKNHINNTITRTHVSKESKKKNEFVDYFELTDREQDALFYLLDGKSTKSIAKELNISDGTAKNHILSIFKKTSVHSRFELLTLFNKFMGNK